MKNKTAATTRFALSAALDKDDVASGDDRPNGHSSGFARYRAYFSRRGRRSKISLIAHELLSQENEKKMSFKCRRKNDYYYCFSSAGHTCHTGTTVIACRTSTFEQITRGIFLVVVVVIVVAKMRPAAR